MPAQDDRKELILFLDELHELMELAILKHSSLLPKELVVHFHEVWKDSQTSFAELRHSLEHVDAAQLNRVGLTGSHLRLKAAGFRRARGKKPNDTAEGWRKWLLRLLKWANVILGSLSKLLDQADVIKEMKEALENGLEEGEGQ